MYWAGRERLPDEFRAASTERQVPTWKHLQGPFGFSLLRSGLKSEGSRGVGQGSGFRDHTRSLVGISDTSLKKC